MNLIRFSNRLFGFRIKINEPDCIQFETNGPLQCIYVVYVVVWVHEYTVEPLLWGHPFCIIKGAFQEGWPLVRGKNQCIYV